MILCIGEILADLIGQIENGEFVYKRKAGGAPFNVCCGINKFDKPATFVGSVGNDNIGRFLLDFVSRQKIENFIKINPDCNTTLAFVDIKDNGERYFSFFRNNTADYQLNFSDIPQNYLNDAEIIHLGSLMLSEKQGVILANQIVNFAINHDKLLSFDVNFRDDIFKSNPIPVYEKIIHACNILKLSEDELFYFTKENSIESALSHFDNLLVLVTLGKNGSVAYFSKQLIFCAAQKVTPVDTTGAGDAFLSGFLSQFDKNKLNLQNIGTWLEFANICGGLTTTKLGAIDALPTLEEIASFRA